MNPLIVVQIVLASMTLENFGGDAIAPVVSFTPNWGKIFPGDFVTLTCNVGLQAIHEVYWYKDNEQLRTNQPSFKIKPAKMEHSGHYQCRTRTSGRSTAVRLDVVFGHVLLQHPPSVTEGDNVSVRCHSMPGYKAKDTTFYKDGTITRSTSSNSVLFVGKAHLGMAGKYKCTKKLCEKDLYYTYTDEVLISVTELFSQPQLRASPQPIGRGAQLTLTCATTLNPLRSTTALHFAFYKNRETLRGFSARDKYQVPSAQPGDSGDYTCEVTTAADGVKKQSATLRLQIADVDQHLGTSAPPRTPTHRDGEEYRLEVRRMSYVGIGCYSPGVQPPYTNQNTLRLAVAGFVIIAAFLIIITGK